jgi:hypothetical protein
LTSPDISDLLGFSVSNPSNLMHPEYNDSCLGLDLLRGFISPWKKAEYGGEDITYKEAMDVLHPHKVSLFLYGYPKALVPNTTYYQYVELCRQEST